MDNDRFSPLHKISPEVDAVIDEINARFNGMACMDTLFIGVLIVVSSARALEIPLEDLVEMIQMNWDELVDEKPVVN